MNLASLSFLIEECIPLENRKEIAENIILKLRENQILMLTKQGLTALKTDLLQQMNQCAILLSEAIEENIEEINIEDYCVPKN